MSRRRNTPKLTPIWLPWIRSKLADRLRGRLSRQALRDLCQYLE